MLLVDTNIWLAAVDRRSELHVGCAQLVRERRDELDGLVWWSAGYRNVIAPGGPDGLPADLPDQLIEAGVTRVLLAQARTPAGEATAGVLTAALGAQGLACFRVVFPHGCDVGFVAVDGNDPTVVLGGRLRAAQWLGEGPAPSRQQTVTGDGSTKPPPPRPVRGPRPLPAAPGPRSDRPLAPDRRRWKPSRVRRPGRRVPLLRVPLLEQL